MKENIDEEGRFEARIYQLSVERQNMEVAKGAQFIKRYVEKKLKDIYSVDQPASWSDVQDLIDEGMRQLENLSAMQKADLMAWQDLESQKRCHEACQYVLLLGHSRKETAEIMGISAKGVRSHLSDGQRFLKERTKYYLNQTGDNEGDIEGRCKLG